MKKAISLLLSAAILTSTVSAASWPGWAADARKWADTVAISQELTAAPETVVTRSMAARLLYEAAGKPEGPRSAPFADVSGADEPAIAWAAAQGYIQGENGLYRPEAPVTRQAFAAILHRQAGTPAVSGTELDAFSDALRIAPWAKAPLLWCVKAGLMNGKLDGRMAPQASITMAEAVVILRRAELLPDVAQLRADLETLTTAPRPIGSAGEKAAVQYLKTRFAEMGYTVTLQAYTDKDGRNGTNVIATRKAPVADADTLVLSAHHDSVPTAYGANDNASGVAALLAVAEALRNVPTDTELRFISFTDEESGKNGSRAYTASLTEAEKARMVGNIQLDMLGGLGSRGMAAATTDGEANWLSDLLRGKNAALPLIAETASDHSSFQLAGVPAVLLMQEDRGYLYHSAADTADQLDLWAIAGAVRSTVEAAGEIVSPETPSYRQLARKQGNGYTYCQTRQNVIYFDSSLADTEAFIGAAGELVDQKVVEGTGWKDTYDTYRYSMRWFGGETPMNTYYQYRNGFLQSIEVRPSETGYTLDQVSALLQAMYGDPTRTGTDRSGAPYESWQDEIYSKYITLTGGETFTVSVGKYAVGISNTLATYPVVNGKADITDPEDKKVWDYLCSILPEENRQKITEFQLFTDGASGILAYTSPIRDENGVPDNTQFSISVDYYDVFDENGAKKDWSKLTYTILHEYGHVLLEDETQIDITLGKGTHDPTAFREDSFRKGFYDKFWKDLGDSAVTDYEENPTHYVSRYGANYFHEDIADTFAVFLLGGEPQGKSVAEEKLRFFWKDADMVALRTKVRENLSLDQPEAPVVPVKPQNPEPAGETVKATSLVDIQTELLRAITSTEQPAVFDVSGVKNRDTMEMDVRNAYFTILSQHPEDKYAYDLATAVEGDRLTCTVSYMPYRTGAYPAGFRGAEAGSLADLVETARANLSKESIPVRITNPALAVDDMNRALQQVGGGYLLCQLDRDGTHITVTPQGGLTRREALDRLAKIDALAAEACKSCVKPGMSQEEQVKVLYTWLTENVRYDFRYYSEPQNMPYDSTTALGALRDHLAICGGYAQAFQMLLTQAGIPCVTVSGKLGNEYHMWNMACLDGQWRYFDPTSDRGRANYGYRCFGVDAASLNNHTWDQAWADRLTKALT